MENKSRYLAKYLRVATKNIGMEAVGYMTILNANRSRTVKCQRFIHYDKNNPNLYFHVYYPMLKNPIKKLPMFVYCHGGGWVSGLPQNREGLTTTIASFGFVVVNVFYGLAPYVQHPQQAMNIVKAIDFAIKNKELFNIDANNIFIGGESAGAHLSSMVAAISSNIDYKSTFDIPDSAKNLTFKGAVLISGVYDINDAMKTKFNNMDFYIESYCGMPYQELSDYAKKHISPINFITEKFPPSYLVAGEHDGLKDCTPPLKAKLDEMNVENQYFFGKGKFAIHAFPVCQLFEISKIVAKEIRDFLYKQLGTNIEEMQEIVESDIITPFSNFYDLNQPKMLKPISPIPKKDKIIISKFNPKK